MAATNPFGVLIKVSSSIHFGGEKVNGLLTGVNPNGVNPKAPNGVKPNGVNPNGVKPKAPNGVNPKAPNGVKLKV